MDQLETIKEACFTTGNNKLGKELAAITRSFKMFPSLEARYLQRILDLEKNGTLSITTLEQIKKDIKLEEPKLIKQSKKELIFRILNEYLEYIHHILFNQNESKQFNSIVRSFATELSVKLLYALVRIDDMVANVNNLDLYIGKTLDLAQEQKVVYEIDMYLQSLDRAFPDDYNKLNTVLADVRAKKLPDEFITKIKGKKLQSHANVKYLNALPNHLKALINYYVIKYFSEPNLDPSKIDNEKFDYIDYFLMTRDFLKFEKDIKTNNALQEINNERFAWNRYDPLHESTETNYQFALALAMASYLVFKDTKEHYQEDSSKEMAPVPSALSFISKHYTKNIQSLLDKNNDKRNLLIELNKRYPNLMVEINDGLLLSEFEDFITKMNIDEINYLFNEITTNPNSNSICDLIRYAINFKNKLSNYNSLTFNDAKYARINKLFKLLADTQDLTYVGAQLRNWLDSIDLHELTSEELVELNKIDPNFVYSQLDYRSQVIYKKCQELNIQFRYYYRRFTNAQLELLFNIYKNTGDVIPLQAAFLTNLEIAKAYENSKLKSKDFSSEIYEAALRNSINLPVMDNNKQEHFNGLSSWSYIISSISNTAVILKYTDIKYAVFNNLKDSYYDADFGTIKAIAECCNNDVGKMNTIPKHVILCSFDRLSILLKQYDGDLDRVCSLPFAEFSKYPIIEYDNNNRRKDTLIKYLYGPSKFTNDIINSQQRGMNRNRIISEFPGLLSIKYLYNKVNDNLVENLRIIKNNTNEEDFVGVVKLFSDEDSTSFDGEKFWAFSDCLFANSAIFYFVLNQVTKGDISSNIEGRVDQIRRILDYIGEIDDIDVLKYLTRSLLNKNIDDLKEQDYKRISLFPGYLLKSSICDVGYNAHTYLFEKVIEQMPKEEGVKVLNPQEVLLSYSRLKEYLTKSNENGETIFPNIDIAPLMYIDYDDVCHLIHVYEDLVSKGYNLEKDIILAMINYIARTNYKIDVHTFGAQDFLALIVQGFMKDNGPEQRSPKVA